jgi:4-carboxymuconolactone decarboxylase
MTRQKETSPANFTPEQKAEYETFTRTRRPQADGSLGGPFDPWMTNPELFHRLTGLGGMLWTRTSLDRGIVELAICITAKIWESNVEWAAHAPRAVEYGIPRSALDQILQGRSPKGWDLHEQVYDIVMSLHQRHKLSVPLYDAAVKTFGERGLAEPIAVTGYYTLVSMTLNAFEVKAAAGAEAPFRRDD